MRVKLVLVMILVLAFAFYLAHMLGCSAQTEPAKVAPSAEPVLTVVPSPVLTPSPLRAEAPLASEAPKFGLDEKIWGAHAPDGFEAFQELVGKKADIQALFAGWPDPFPSDRISAQGDQIALIFWEQIGVTLDQITDGSQDAYIAQFCADAKAHQGKVFLAPFHEMNGEWIPWGGMYKGNTPAKVVSAWKHVRDLFSGADNVKFVWVVNQHSVPNVPENSIAVYYPGDEYVDVVGVDGFNFGPPSEPWLSYEQIFASAMVQLKKYPKPILIASMGCAPGPQKPAWITDTLSKIYADKRILGFVLFNENKAGQGEWERNWLVNSDEASLEAVRKGIK